MSRPISQTKATPLAVTVASGVICAIFVMAVGVMASARLSSKQAAAVEAQARSEIIVRPASAHDRTSPTHRVPTGTDENGVTTVSV